MEQILSFPNLRLINNTMENERIKIAYSWIGPKGPIWNTELPNVLSFACVAEGAKPESHFFWADDIWNRLFSPRKKQFELYSAQALDIEDNRAFIFPYSLTWRVEFGNYFCGKTGIFEFSHFPWHLMRLIRHNNGYLLIDHSVEAFMSPQQLHAMHAYFGNIHGLPLHKIIYLTGCMNAQDIYDNYCENQRIPNNPESRLKVVTYPSSQQIFATYLENGTEEPEYDTERVPEKVFLMWNRRFRRHRIEMALCLEKNDIVDRSYISFNRDDLERPNISFENAIDMQNLLSSNSNLNLTPEIVQRFKQKLPLVLDGETNVNQMCEDFDNATRPYYQNSLVSIITETNYENPELTLTEKSFKPIKEKHPFIIVGVPGALRAMRNMGFKTFGEFWDESYDDVECPRVRMQRLSFLTEQISKWTPDQIREFRRKVKPILEHNYKQLRVPSSQLVIDNIVEHINTHYVKEAVE